MGSGGDGDLCPSFVLWTWPPVLLSMAEPDFQTSWRSPRAKLEILSKNQGFHFQALPVSSYGLGRVGQLESHSDFSSDHDGHRAKVAAEADVKQRSQGRLGTLGRAERWRGGVEGWEGYRVGKGRCRREGPNGEEAGLTLLAAELGKPSGETHATFIGGSVDPGGEGKSPPGTRTPD